MKALDLSSQVMLVIPEYKLKSKLQTHISNLKKPNDIIGSVALFITLLYSSFSMVCVEDNVIFLFGLMSRDAVLATSVLLAILSVGYLTYTIINRIKNSPSIEDIIEDIKTD